MPPSFAAVRERYLDDLVANEWYDVRTFGKKQRLALSPPDYLVELVRYANVTAVEMHSHTPRSDGLIEPQRIAAWTQALFRKGYFRHAHVEVPLAVVVTDHDYIYGCDELRILSRETGLTLLAAAEVSTAHGHVLYYGAQDEVIASCDLRRPQLTVQPDGPTFLRQVAGLEGGVAVPAHPYRETSILRELPGDEVAPLLESVEILNGKTPADQNLSAIEFARRHGLRGTGGSDAHQISRLYSYLTLFDGPIATLDDLVVGLRQGDFFPVHGEHLRFKDA